MPDLTWRARVRGGSGGRLGAGFLIAPDLVMTCAHVVRDLDEAVVDLPGLEHDLPAKVERCSQWRRQGDGGDVALLRLSAPAGPRPARFAHPRDLGPGPREPGNPLGLRTYTTYGFPRPAESHERHATVCSGPHMVQRQEWWQLDPVAGERVQKGYSGAAVYDPRTGEVAGMVTEADASTGTAKMLPITTIRLYWDELDDLLPLDWLAPQARRELRLLLAGLPCTEAMRAEVFRLTGGKPRLRSAWDPVRHLGDGWPDEPDRLRDYLTALDQYLPLEPAAELGSWIARHLPAARPRPAASRPAAVVVRLDPLTHGGFDLTVQTWIDGVTATSFRTRTVAKDEVRRTVEAGVREASREVVDHDWRIEFAVPLRWLTKPYDEWTIARGMPMRRFPLVVRDVERLRPRSAVASPDDHLRRYQARQRWEVLGGKPRPAPYPIGCDTHPRTKAGLERKLEARLDRCLLVYGARPPTAWLQAALGTGVPVMLWPRGRCTDHEHGDCHGHRLRDDLVEAVRERPPEDLPKVAMELRRQASDAPEGEPHCGRGLTLFYDDPSRLPDPPCSMEM
ncbi:trypsin-like peptidase domain-containing protein [Actinomadura viridis]|uniref:VMAP-C domain-containing protein n=1 Tax=Actinomadura viridis TaxID=58110 RepID=UPI0036941615